MKNIYQESIVFSSKDVEENDYLNSMEKTDNLKKTGKFHGEFPCFFVVLRFRFHNFGLFL